MNATIIALLAAVATGAPDYSSLVRTYYQAELHRGANPRIHAVRVIGKRQIRQGTTTLVCVNYTMRLRIVGSDFTSTEALYFDQADRVVRRDSGNEGLQACSVV